MQTECVRRWTRIILGIVFAILANRSVGFAQQQAVYNQYLYNNYYTNPAFSGIEGVTEFVLLTREQWLGYKDRPRTYSLNFQMNLLGNPLLETPQEMKSIRRGTSTRSSSEIFEKASMGIAATLISDVNGRLRRTGIQAAYSYQILIDDWLCAAGIGLSFMQYKANVLPKDLFDVNIDDPLVASGKPILGYAPDVNLGFVASNGNYWGGVSVNYLLQNSLQFGTYNQKNHYRQLRQYYLMSGYKILLRPGVILEPSTIFTINGHAQWMADVNIKVAYKNQFWGAVGYRTMSDIAFILGARYRRLSFAYAFSYSISGPQVTSRWGAHELLVGFRIASKKG